MSPLDAALKEITLELEALRRRIGNGPMPESISFRVEFDRETGMPRDVRLTDEYHRRIQGGTLASRPHGVGARREPVPTR